MGQIRKLMFVKPRTVRIGDSVVEAAKLMKGEETGIAPIVEDGRLVGVVTDRDITIRVVAEGARSADDEGRRRRLARSRHRSTPTRISTTRSR